MSGNVRHQIDDLLAAGVVNESMMTKILQSLCKVKGARVKARRVGSEAFDGVSVTEVLDLEKGGEFQWHYADPSLLLQLLVNSSPSLQRLYSDALSRHPNSQQQPWSMILGMDEFTPGSFYKAENLRKTMVLSFTFAELGKIGLYSENAWATPICIRSHVCKQVRGGWPRMLKTFLHRVMYGPYAMPTVGAALIVNGRPVTIFATVSAILSDNDGLRLSFALKGSSGLKPCLRCWNVWMKNEKPPLDSEVDICEDDPTKFQATRLTTLHQAVDVIVAAKACHLT